MERVVTELAQPQIQAIFPSSLSLGTRPFACGGMATLVYYTSSAVSLSQWKLSSSLDQTDMF